MTKNVLPLRPLATERSPWLRGALSVPGDLAISHLALMLGAMARGESVIEGALESDDVLATAGVLRALGARIERRAGRWHVMGIGVGGFLEPEGPLDFAGADGSLARAMGLIGIYDFDSRFTGNSELSARPLRALFDPLARLGIDILDHQDGCLPITLRGPRLRVPPIYRAPAASARFKDCVLLAGLPIPGTTEVVEPTASRDHAERLLQAFGARLQSTTDAAGATKVELEGLPNLRAQRVAVPADASLAAYGLVAALIVPGSEVTMARVGLNPRRSGLLQTLIEMGGAIEVEERSKSGGEDMADLRVRHTPLAGVTVPPDRLPALADELAALAVAAAFAEGDTVVQGLGPWRSESGDRPAAIAGGLAVNGVECELGSDTLLVRGRGRVRGGGRVATGMDHRMAMSFLVMGMAADDEVVIDDQSSLDRRYPSFLHQFESIGASFIRYSE